MTKEEIAKILKELRIKAGFTQIQAATKINRKQQTLASWETGQSQPDANTLFILCAMYGVSVDEAFGFKKKQILEIPSQYNFSPEAAEVAEAYDKADFKSRNSARYALDLPLLPESHDLSRKTSSARDKQDPPISERVAEAEEEYIKSTSGGARITASSALNTTDGKNEEAV